MISFWILGEKWHTKFDTKQEKLDAYTHIEYEQRVHMNREYQMFMHINV